VFTTIIYIMAAVVICTLVGLNFAVMYNKTKAKVISFVFGALTLPVILGSIFALVLIEPDMDMPRFIVGCLLISGIAIGMISGGVYFAEKAENNA
jgi:ABC-type sugar transport system permease subunit